MTGRRCSICRVYIKAIAAPNKANIPHIVVPMGLCLGSVLVIGAGAELAGGVVLVAGPGVGGQNFHLS